MTPKDLTKIINRKIDRRKISINLPTHGIKHLQLSVVYFDIDPSAPKNKLRSDCDRFVNSEQKKLIEQLDTLYTEQEDKITSLISNLPKEKQNLILDEVNPKMTSITFGRKLTNQNIEGHVKSHFKNIISKIEDMIGIFKLEGLVSDKYSEDDYLNSFEKARNIKRKFIFHAGPTNSGKTYHALNILKEADTGCYLAPLRLLAHEVFEDLNAEDYPTDLITGEERLEVPGMKYVSSTIEMADFSREVDVAIIDEIQMIADQYRGWAWTQAVVGIPAKTIVLAGSPDAIPVVKKLVERILNEELEIVEYERKTQLIVEDSSTNACQPGDCVVVFSRKRIFDIKDQLSNQCSIIYGSLSPDVRKSEAKKFREGETNIVTSTDAIGMGLNLPIRRIVFADISKFNGSEFDICDNSLIRQIAGRAGRYGKFEEGYVTATTPEALAIIKDALNEKSPKLYVDKFQISPNKSAIEQIGKETNTTDLVSVFRVLAASMLSNKYFKMMNLDSMIEITKNTHKDLSLDIKFQYSCAPVNTKIQNELSNIYKWSEKHFKNEQVTFDSIRFFDSPAYDESFKLRNYEDRVKILTVYCWLSFRYPDIYVDRERVIEEMILFNNHIMDTLNTLSKKRKKKKLYIQ